MLGNNQIDKENAKIIKNTILKRLEPNHCPPFDSLHGVNEHVEEIYSLIERSIKTGEGNSILLVGKQGTSKATIMKHSLQKVKAAYPNQFSVVMLNGLVCTDFRFSLKEIYLQLNRGSEFPDIWGDDEDEDENDTEESSTISKASTTDMLDSILQSVLSGNRETSQPIVFYLEGVELFCEHPKQTLLYNLFDWTQSQKIPVVVLGTSSEMSVYENFEKRVKSRFSRRLLYPTGVCFEDYVTIFKETLLVEDQEQWNKQIQLLMEEDEGTNILLKRQYALDRSISGLKTIMFRSLSTYEFGGVDEIMSEIFSKSFLFQTYDHNNAILKSLSALEYCLLISIVNCLEDYNLEKVNFEMVYKNYQSYCVSTKDTVQLYDRAIALKAFERLEVFELIKNVEGPRSLKEYRQIKLLIDGEEVRQTAKLHPHLPLHVIRWATLSNI